MPPLNANPPPFSPTGRYTQERRDAFRKLHDTGFLWPAELDLIDDFMCNQNEAFAWNEPNEDVSEPTSSPQSSSPSSSISPGYRRTFRFHQVSTTRSAGSFGRNQAGVYEPSNSSYRSRWFCVLKKDGKSFASYTHSGVTPIPEHLAEQFGGRACGGMLDLYVGYDEREIAESSRDLTTFQTPYGAHRLVTLPMGWTNAVPIFHDDVTHILQPEIPHITIPYIDDVPIRGPASRYLLSEGTFETIRENPSVRRFVWEHLHNLNRVVQRMRYCNGTFSGVKSMLCGEEIVVVGHRCTHEGRRPEDSRVAVVKNWGPCKDLSEVRAFLESFESLSRTSRNAHPLVYLTRKGIPFEFGPKQIQAQEDLKQALIESPALRAINYNSSANVILAVDTSYIAVGFYPLRFGSITLNDRESRFSQPKLEIYGLFHALRALRLYLLGVRNLVVEVDARYIKGMLRIRYIPFRQHQSWIQPRTRRTLQKTATARYTEELEDDFEDWIDRIHGFPHFLYPPILNRTSRQFTVATFALDNADQESQREYEPPADPPDEETPPKLIREWQQTLARPQHFSDADYEAFVKFAVGFFCDDHRLWKRDPLGAHKLVVATSDRLRVLKACHDDIGHRGAYATRSAVCERFWWPHVAQDVACRRDPRTTLRKNPSRHDAPPTIGRLSLPPSKFRALRKETSKTLGDFVFENILCRWGALSEIVTDNGPAFVKAIEYLAKKYHINHIRISGYNSRTNGIVERSHYDIRGALFKAADGDQKRWAEVVFSVFWAERITVRRRMGCSPYFAVTGTHPIIPLDISEATYLQPAPESILSTADLIARRAIALQKRFDQVQTLRSKVYEARVTAAIRFEREHARTIKDFDFKRGDLVLMRHTQIEKSLNRKMRARCLGPLVVVSRNKGGAYILSELDSSVFDRPVAAFRVIPYFARKAIVIPNELLDIDDERLRELLQSNSQGDDEDIPDDPGLEEVDEEDDTPSE
ncbi:Transposon Tf2-6 polyprotein [Grifola frondosa]|uniref:Transposon Tf2-6 polyprotein n=1 Tax=Grifola frondosa TaxID=5627 RepID=A0A1C7MIX6_GRIFR|nr:Transposon Tf2-6 polyprotein [Grifola frondosa]